MEIGPSKTQRKREMHELQALGERLIALNPDQLARVPIPEALREAVFDAKRIRSREGLRRQLQFIGRLMREVDAASIRASIEAWTGRAHALTAMHHRAERWRAELLADETALTAFAREYPRADLQALRTAVRATQKEQLAGRPPQHFRELFRLIRAAMSVPNSEPSEDPPPI